MLIHIYWYHIHHTSYAIIYKSWKATSTINIYPLSIFAHPWLVLRQFLLWHNIHQMSFDIHIAWCCMLHALHTYHTPFQVAAQPFVVFRHRCCHLFPTLCNVARHWLLCAKANEHHHHCRCILLVLLRVTKSHIWTTSQVWRSFLWALMVSLKPLERLRCSQEPWDTIICN